jgi:acyl dehydratase
MRRSGVRLGQRVGPFELTLDSGLIESYADATGGPSRRLLAAPVVPPVIVSAGTWTVQEAARAELVPAEFQAAATGGVHGDHDLVVHRPVRSDDVLQTWVEGHAARTIGSNSVVTLRYETRNARNDLFVEQLWSTVWLGITCLEVGDAPPLHAFPEAARARLLGSWEVDVDDDMARRYAQCSGDWSAHHFEIAAAQHSGADRPFLHGLCTLALCARGLCEVVAAGSPDRLERIALRFARPVPLGERLTVRYYDAGELGFAFEADAAGSQVITNGRAALR